jgi:hypothetical protein
MLLLSVLVAAAVAWAGLRSRAALALQWPLALLALALAAERLVQLTRLPPPAAGQPDFDIAGWVKPLVVTQTDLVAYGEEVVLRARLPSLTERVVLPAGQRMGVIVSVASHGHNVAWTFHNGPDDWGWALLGPMGWIVAPQHLFDSLADSSRMGAFVVEDQGELMLVTSVYREGAVRLEVQQIAADGTLAPQEDEDEDFALADLFLLPQAVCRTSGRWQIRTLQQQSCRLGPAGAEVQGCEEELPPDSPCRNDLGTHGTLQGALQQTQPGDWVAADPWVRATAGGPQLRASWLSSDGLRLEDAGDGTFLMRRWVDWPEARAHGLLPTTHTQVVRVDAALQEISPAGWAQGADPLAFLLDTGVEVLLVGHDGAAQARFDRRTLQRLDQPPPLQAAWAQLEHTGGAQPLVTALALSALGMALVPLGLFTLMRRQEPPLALRLASGLWLVVALPAAAALLARW